MSEIGLASAILNSVLLISGIIIVGLLLNSVVQFISKILVTFVGINITHFLLTKLTFIGVIHHELSHAITALLTGAKVKRIELFTMFKADRLGSVQFIPRGSLVLQGVQVVFTSIAPMVYGFISLFFLFSVSTDNMLLIVLLWYLRISILIHATMSPQDIHICLTGLPIVIFILIVFFFVTGIDLRVILLEYMRTLSWI